MPRAYSVDLRERVLVACERREGSREEIAKRFRVAVSTLYLWLGTAHEEGRRAPKPPARVRLPIGGAAKVLVELVAEQSDATLAEYADRLAARTGVRRSLAAVCRALKGLGLVRKKRPSGRPSRTAPMSPKRAKLGAPSWLGSIQAA
jgi:transposase